MKIKDLLTQDNWIKYYSTGDDKGCYNVNIQEATKFCLIGAIHKCYNVWQRCNIENKIIKYIKDKGFESEYKFIAKFNDAPDTSYKDIHQLTNTLDI